MKSSAAKSSALTRNDDNDVVEYDDGSLQLNPELRSFPTISRFVHPSHLFSLIGMPLSCAGRSYSRQIERQITQNWVDTHMKERYDSTPFFPPLHNLPSRRTNHLFPNQSQRSILFPNPVRVSLPNVRPKYPSSAARGTSMRKNKMGNWTNGSCPIGVYMRISTSSDSRKWSTSTP
jgi:hypothetical protein